MIRELPVFVRDEQYRENRGGRYRFTTLDSITVHLDLPSNTFPDPILFYDKNGIEWARLVKNKLHIRPHYSWDGCSPKARFTFLWLGTPDPHCTRLASLVHDVLYQFIATDHFPFSRFQCDAAFYDIMKLSGFLLAGTFHGAVRLWGGLFAANQKNSGAWSKVLTPKTKASTNSDEAA
jgi:hypothetical protein